VQRDNFFLDSSPKGEESFMLTRMDYRGFLRKSAVPAQQILRFYDKKDCILVEKA